MVAFIGEMEINDVSSEDSCERVLDINNNLRVSVLYVWFLKMSVIFVSFIVNCEDVAFSFPIPLLLAIS